MTKVNIPKIDDNLLYRRQYFIGPKFVDRFKSWNRIKVGESVYITAHPDLTITTAKKGDTEIALLGFMFDPYNIKANNENILNTIINSSDSFEDAIKITDQYSGRWILIYTRENEKKLFHDPAGLRQIFYNEHKSTVWCGAQPHILANILNKDRKTNSDLIDFINSKQYDLYEHNWVGNETLYNDICHLFPNHYLDLNGSGYTRYWPNQYITESPLKEVVDTSNEILTGLLKAANYRHSLSQAVTSGWDTRLLLAASKDIRKDVYYYVQQLENLKNNHADLRIPKILLSQLGLEFRIIDCNDYTDEFDDLYQKSISTYQSDIKKKQHYNFFSKFHGKLNISGNGNPLIKIGLPRINEISAYSLAQLIGFHNQEYAIKNIRKWLNQTLPYAKNNNIHIVTLFYWEMRFGNWAPMYNAELDLSIEEFAPFNCRRLINSILSLDDKYRMPSNMLLYQEMIRTLWPEVLTEPVNPGRYTIYKKIKKLFIKLAFNFLKKIKLYNFVRMIFRKLRTHN